MFAGDTRVHDVLLPVVSNFRKLRAYTEPDWGTLGHKRLNLFAFVMAPV